MRKVNGICPKCERINCECIKTISQKIGGLERVYIKGQYWTWNTAYHVYNSTKNYAQLTTKEFVR